MKKSSNYLKKAAMWYFKQIEATSTFTPSGMAPLTFYNAVQR